MKTSSREPAGAVPSAWEDEERLSLRLHAVCTRTAIQKRVSARHIVRTRGADEERRAPGMKLLAFGLATGAGLISCLNE